MARVVGTAGEVTQAGATIAGIKNWELDYVVAALNSTGFDSAGVSAFVAGPSEWKGKFDGFKDGAPLTIGTIVALVLKETQTATQKWNGQALINGVHAKTGHDALVGYSYDFQGTGALTIPTA